MSLLDFYDRLQSDSIRKRRELCEAIAPSGISVRLVINTSWQKKRPLELITATLVNIVGSPYGTLFATFC